MSRVSANDSQARAVQIDIDRAMPGLRYPVEVNLHGDAAETLAARLPLLSRCAGLVAGVGEASDGDRRSGQSAAGGLGDVAVLKGLAVADSNVHLLASQSSLIDHANAAGRSSPAAPPTPCFEGS